MPVNPQTKTVACRIRRFLLKEDKRVNDISDNAYFGALINKYIPRAPKIMLGIKTATIGGKPPFKANIFENCIDRMYAKLRNIPIPNGNPTPPRTFLEDNATPINVKINAERG